MLRRRVTTLQREPSVHAREDGILAQKIAEIFEHNRQVYGSPRIHAELRDQGIQCGRKRVVRLMQHQHLSARRPRHRIVTTRRDPTARYAANLLDGDFTASAPNTKWVTDVTLIGTRQGPLFLAAVLDLFSRAIVGWAMDSSQDEALVERALTMAVVRRCPEPGLLHHSDRGCQYTSHAYQALLCSYEMQASMSGKGNCYDNAVMERFFGTLKDECVWRFTFETADQAQHVVFEYIECFYNRVRRHSLLGYLSPTQYEQLMS